MKKIILFVAIVAMNIGVFAQDNHPVASAASVSFDWCYKVVADAEDFKVSKLPATWHKDYEDQQFDHTFLEGDEGKVHTLEFTKNDGCTYQIDVNLIKSSVPEGVTSAAAVFTINSSGGKVYISRGNLKYCPNPSEGPKTHKTKESDNATGRFEFEEKQYQYTAQMPANYNSSSVWHGYFMAGTSGYGKTNPYSSSTSSDQVHYPLTGADSWYDWGVYNAIYNGGNEPGLWRTLTKNEWYYIFFERGTSMYAPATVVGVKGIIIKPDNWPGQPSSCPAWATGTPSNSNQWASYMSYKEEQWADMEAQGAIFLPAAGFYKTNYKTNISGYYTATGYDRDYMEAIGFGYYMGNLFKVGHDSSNDYGYLYGGNSVRLAQDIPAE